MSVPPLSAATKQQVVVSVESSETNLRIANSTDHGVAWRVTSTDGVAMEPSSGVLAPRESSEMKIRRDDSYKSNLVHDRVGIEWIKAPPEVRSGDVDEEWFNGTAIVHRKNFSITDE
ncbi:MSP domain protein [Teladorsagia circumcincta]|uniref:MSP domain protein n=1 Tax=Teladorsagia circumcincta TaxID=45464 RepID=A0A2G9TN78_TELCI|nr:MSP domain protein [Teladorsagia circumcincta]